MVYFSKGDKGATCQSKQQHICVSYDSLSPYPLIPQTPARFLIEFATLYMSCPTALRLCYAFRLEHSRTRCGWDSGIYEQ